MLSHPRYLKSKNIKLLLPEITYVRFEVLKEYNHPSYLRRKETEYISLEWDNPLLLNRCPDAKTPKNMRPYFGYIKPSPKPLKGIPEYMRPKKTALFSNSGEFIKVYNSRSELERDLKIKHDIVEKILNGKRGQPRKYKLKSVSLDGSFIEPPLYINKPQTNRYITPSVPIYQYNTNGIFINKFNSVKDAAITVGCSRSLIFRVAGNKKDSRGCRSLTAKGYIWKYADEKTA